MPLALSKRDAERSKKNEEMKAVLRRIERAEEGHRRSGAKHDSDDDDSINDDDDDDGDDDGDDGGDDEEIARVRQLLTVT